MLLRGNKKNPELARKVQLQFGLTSSRCDSAITKRHLLFSFRKFILMKEGYSAVVAVVVVELRGQRQIARGWSTVY